MKSGRYWFWMTMVLGGSVTAPGCSASSDDAAGELGGGEPTEAAAKDEVGTSEEALLGGLDFGTDSMGLAGHVCTADERYGAAQMLILARTVVRTQAFADCVTQLSSTATLLGLSKWGPYVRCSGEPSGANASTIIAAARNTRPVKLVCEEGSSGGETIPSNGTGTHDIMSVVIEKASEILENETFDERMRGLAASAQTFVHEAVHNWGYLDSRSSCPSGPNRASYIVGACTRELVNLSLNRCNVQACNNAAELNLLDSYRVANASTGQLASSVGCACVRDHVGPAQTTIPASPRLGTNDQDDSYGMSTATGDFNGDGFQDLAVGAPYDVGGQGRVYLYRGTAMGLYPWKVLSQGGTANEAGDRFGSSLAAGRLDGDWFDDLAVGIPGENSSAGAVLVFRGGSNDVVAVRRIVEVGFDDPEANDQFGTSLAIGRFHSQTWPALAVGAYAERVFDRTNGMVFIFQGSGDVSGSVPLTHVAYSYANTATDTGAFGFSLSAGKIDGDPYDDLLVGDPLRNSSVGAVHIVRGRANQGAWFPDQRLDSPLGPGTAQFYGYSVAVTDLIGVGGIAVGAPISDSSKGRLYLYTSSGGLWGGLLGNLNGGNFAMSLRAGRTPDELLVGAPNQNGGIVGALRRTLASGSLGVTWGQAVAQNNDVSETGDRFGQSIAVGDFDGDGDGDLAVGAPGEGLGSSPASSGAVSLFNTDGAGTLTSWGIAHQAL